MASSIAGSPPKGRSGCRSSSMPGGKEIGKHTGREVEGEKKRAEGHVTRKRQVFKLKSTQILFFSQGKNFSVVVKM